MNAARTPHQEVLIDRIGLKLAARLDEAPLPHDISERLRVARDQAVAQRKKEFQLQTARSASMSGGAAVLGGEHYSWWHRLAGVLPLVALAAGLVIIGSSMIDERTLEVADADVELLTDELPPDAHTDPGFAQFLKFGLPSGSGSSGNAPL